MLFVFFFAFLFVCLKLLEKIVNNWRKKSCTANSETTVLITGGCSGIGKQLAINFAKNLKCHIIIYDILPELPKEIRMIYKNKMFE